MKSNITTPVALVALAGLLCAGGVTAADWPSWRGPGGNGVSEESSWVSEGKAESLWTADVGLGYSSFTVADGALVTLGYFEDQEIDRVQCLDALTGELRWKYEYPAEKWAKYHGGGSNATPVIDGDHVYLINREAQFFCFNKADGTVVWSKELMKEYELEQPTWGFAGSPLVYGDLVFVNVGKLIAFDKTSGEEKFASKDYGHAYSTPYLMQLDGKDVIALFAGSGLAILNAEDGSELNQFEWKTQYDVNAATPIDVGNGRVFISSGYNHGCALVDVSTTPATAVWESKRMRNQMATSVLMGDHLYGFDEAELKCLDLEGNEMWNQRGMGKGALIGAGDRLIVMSGRGELVIVKASPDGYQELSKVKVVDGGVDWTIPVIVDGLIYCRNSPGQLVCRDHRGE
ncbi:MAG: PQQ-binding-like beta-propeller repeat protein [Phycisphaerales bacterium]